jgi:hypothetical protein
LVEHVYRPELAAYWNWALKRIDSEDRTAWRRPPEFTARQKVIVDRFYDTPLAQMAPTMPRDPKHLADALTRTASLVQTLLNEAQQ